MERRLKQRVLEGEVIEMSSAKGAATLWHNSKTNTFVLQLNAKPISATKTWAPIANKINTHMLEEVD